ncbi:hypothetical protein AAE478_006935 [Parahypoxylon ruwenzoriense]
MAAVITSSAPDEKHDASLTPLSNGVEMVSINEAELESHEVFKKTEDGVNFRNVSWPFATVIFLKAIFATGVLSRHYVCLSAIRLKQVSLGALDTAIIQGDFKTRHPECHTLADMGYTVGGPWLKELVGALYLIAYVLCSGTGIVGLSVGFNALSDHAICTTWWAFLATAIITAAASIRTLRNIGWLTWIGFLSIFLAVLIVVVGVTTVDRPAAAPQEGDFDLGYHVIAYPTFAEGMTATATIFVSSAGTSAFLPVISEMRNPRDYRKALYICMGLVLCMYLSFSLVVYRWTGRWVANPSLGSAGGTIKKVSYGIGLVGLAVSGCLYQHVAAKYLFVRILRNTRHLQSNTLVHWGLFITVGGTYSTVLTIRDAYATGLIGSAFSCEDNSNSSH